MKYREKLVASVIGMLFGTMNCMTAVAAVMSSSICGTCGYESNMYTVLGHYAVDADIVRECQHGIENGTDSFGVYVEEREYYCSEDGCLPWVEDVTVGYFWQCDGQ